MRRCYHLGAVGFGSLPLPHMRTIHRSNVQSLHTHDSPICLVRIKLRRSDFARDVFKQRTIAFASKDFQDPFRRTDRLCTVETAIGLEASPTVIYRKSWQCL